MQLDSRLSQAFALYEPCSLAADIGTDHAHLPAALLRSGRCARMILTDISPDALKNARDNIARAGLTDRVEFRLGDGLEPLREPCGMVSVLGMGGRTIFRMLTRDPSPLRGAALLLSAHTDLPLVRRAVMEIGYRLVSETPVLDAGRYYLLLKAVPGEEALSPRELRLGKALFRSDSPVLLPYLARRRQVLEAKAAGLRRAADPDARQLAELEEDIALLAAAEKNLR
jgi:tRNA (adenine22-N1)-methyltransferase